MKAEGAETRAPRPKPRETVASGPAVTTAAAALVIAVTFLAYLPSLSGRFIWNDSDYVTAPALRSLGGLARIWTQPGATQQYYPLLHSAFWVQYRFWGDQPLGYHVVTVALHAGAAVLFGLLLRKLAVPGAWLASLLFAVHPVHVESVAWITEQKNTFSTVFYLASALAYVDFDTARRPRAYAAALVLFLLALLCKTVTAPLPAVLLVVLWWRRGRLDLRRDVLPLLPWLLLGAAAGGFSSWVEKGYGGADGTDFSLSPAGRLLVAGHALWFYAAQLVWPFHFNFIYPRWTVDPRDSVQWLYPLGAGLVLGALWAIRGRTRAPLAAALIFAGSLFPVLGFVNLYGSLYSWVWDHWQYLADLAPLALLAAVLTRAAERVAAPRAAGGPLVFCGAAVFLGALTWRHSAMFHDDQALYRTTLARNPHAWMAHYNLANLLEEVPGGMPEAIAQYEATLAVKPDHAKAHNNLGNILANTPGRMAEAIAHFQAALRIDPGDAMTHSNLGTALAKVPGRLDDGIAECEAAVRLNPRLAAAHNNLANALGEVPDRRPERLGEYRAALAIDPDFAAAHFNLGAALAERPDTQAQAAAEYQAVLRASPNDVEAHTARGNILLRLAGRQAEAAAEFESVLHLEPDSLAAHYGLGIALANTPGRWPDAIAQIEAAVRLRPDLPALRTLLEQLRSAHAESTLNPHDRP